MRNRLGLRSKIVGLVTIIAALAAVFVFAGASSATDGGTFTWGGQGYPNSSCSASSSTMLWIFNPHSDAQPTTLHINGENFTGWTSSGNGNNWHLTIPVDGTDFPPVDVTVDYTGTLGDNPILTLSGCNEGGGPPPAAKLAISKDAAGSYDTEYGWTIDKTVDASGTITTTPGGTVTLNYTVTVTHDAGTIGSVKVTGGITVTNPNSADVTISSLTDQLQSTDSSDVLPSDCAITPSGTTSIAPGPNSFTYECDLSGLPNGAITNTATVAWPSQTVDGNQLDADSASWTVPVDFTNTPLDNCVDVTDTYAGDLGTHCVGDPDEVNSGFTFTYSRDITAPVGDCTSVYNNAHFDDNSNPVHSGDADVTVNVCGFNAPLTIGYWKTHMYQCPAHTKTGTNGCNNNGPFTIDFLGQTICTSASCPSGVLVGTLGNYSTGTGTTGRTNALAVFNANNCSNASTSNNNAAACLAAQLLGAELNVANVSNPCICQTIKSAIAALKAVGYNGPGSSVNLTNSGYTRADLITLKTALDNYNNGLGCPSG